MFPPESIRNQPVFWRWAVVSLACLAWSALRVNAANWPRFRGENGDGISSEQGLPSEWKPEQLAWKIDLPGIGHSAPVIWENKLFVTSAGDKGLVRTLFCINATTGEQIWDRAMKFAECPKHSKSSWASSTPATDGKHVFVAFADNERHILFAYDFEGKLAWQKDIGGFDSQHAQGASPILFENTIILPNDQDGPSSLVAFDKETGKQVWTVVRNSGPQSTSYSTPFLYESAKGEPQLICSSSKSGVSALDPRTGKVIWTTGSMPARTVGSPVAADGLIFQTCGGGGQGKLMVAIDPSGKGDVSKSHVRFERTQILPYVPTPIAFRGNLFLWGDHGIVSCMDPKTGKDLWTKRVGGDFSGSPICVEGRLFNVDEKGNVVVLAAAPEFKLLGKNQLGDMCHSTPAAANGRIYFRTFHHLACVAAQP